MRDFLDPTFFFHFREKKALILFVNLKKYQRFYKIKSNIRLVLLKVVIGKGTLLILGDLNNIVLQFRTRERI